MLKIENEVDQVQRDELTRYRAAPMEEKCDISTLPA